MQRAVCFPAVCKIVLYGNEPFANVEEWGLAMRNAVARQRLSQWLALGLLLLAMISRPSVALNSSEFRYATLPKQYQLALDAFRDKPDSQCAALEADAFTRDEDACILHNMLLIGRKATWKNMVPGRTEMASKGRYHKILKKHVVPVLEQADALTSPSATRAELETRLDSVQGLQLPYLMRQSLVELHFTASSRTNDSWSIQEDAQLLAARVNGTSIRNVQLPPRQPARTIRAMRSRALWQRQHVTGAMCAFHRATCNAEAPVHMLQREQWSQIEPHKALPHDAEVDWLRGKARAPSSWELQLNSSRFCLLDATRGAAMALDAADVLTLENVQPSMTIGTMLKHVAAWMRQKASPGAAHGIDHDQLRVALLPESAPLQSVDTPSYRAGDGVRYRCRNGGMMNATVQSVQPVDTSEPKRYTITVDDGDRRVNAEELSEQEPQPKAVRQRDAESTSNRPAEQLPRFKANQRVWYCPKQPASPAPTPLPSPPPSPLPSPSPDTAAQSQPAPRRARIIEADAADGSCTIMLEREERETTALQLSPRPADGLQPTPDSMPSNAPMPLQLESTVEENDLYNQQARIVIPLFILLGVGAPPGGGERRVLPQGFPPTPSPDSHSRPALPLQPAAHRRRTGSCVWSLRHLPAHVYAAGGGKGRPFTPHSPVLSSCQKFVLSWLEILLTTTLSDSVYALQLSATSK